jgi:hypothetical protein
MRFVAFLLSMMLASGIARAFDCVGLTFPSTVVMGVSCRTFAANAVRSNFVATRLGQTEDRAQQPRISGGCRIRGLCRD